MNFNAKYDIFAEAKAVLNMSSPLETFKPVDIGSFVLAWSSKGADTAIRGTLMAFGCDSEGEYATVKQWITGIEARYTLVARLPNEMLPIQKDEVERTIRRDPEVKQPGIPL